MCIYIYCIINVCIYILYYNIQIIYTDTSLKALMESSIIPRGARCPLAPLPGQRDDLARSLRRSSEIGRPALEDVSRGCSGSPSGVETTTQEKG